MKIEKNEIKIRISGLSLGDHEYHFTVEPSDLALPEGFTAPVSVDVTLDKSTRQIYLQADIATAGDFICDRCLDDLKKEISSRLSLVYVFSELDTGSFPPDEVRVITPETMYIDITEDVRESITLAIPLKLLCREDCKGLCPQCGTNWNLASCDCTDQGEIDSRWERLKNIL